VRVLEKGRRSGILTVTRESNPFLEGGGIPGESSPFNRLLDEIKKGTETFEKAR